MSRKDTKSSLCDDYPLARRVRVDRDHLALELRDGRKFTVPLKWFPNVDLAPPAARRDVRVDGGVGIHWPRLGFELGVGGLVRECLRKRVCAKGKSRASR